MTTANTAATKVPTIATTINDAGHLVIAFSNGESFNVNPMALHESIITQAILHGLKQKLVDAAAISRNTETGASATVADKIAAVREVYERITDAEAPSWNAVREGGGNSGGLLYRALVKFYEGKRDATEVKTWLDARTDAEKTALRKNPKIAAIIAEIQAAKPEVAKVDTDALLADLS